MTAKRAVGSNTTRLPDLTGRDWEITSRALAYAIVAIDRLPFVCQESSDRDDMLTILKARASRPDQLAALIHGSEYSPV